MSGSRVLLGGEEWSSPSRRRRLAAFATDTAIYATVLFFGIWGAVWVGLSEGIPALLQELPVAGIAAFASGYPAVFSALGWSPGKRVADLVLLDAEGRRPGAVRGLRRTVGIYSSGALFYLGHLSALRDPHLRTSYDRSAGTWVVRSRGRPLLPPSNGGGWRGLSERATLVGGIGGFAAHAYLLSLFVFHL